MSTQDCAFFAQLESATARLMAARDARAISDHAEQLVDLAASFCASAAALVDEAFEQPSVRALIAGQGSLADMEGGRAILLGLLQGGCLRCNGRSPFDRAA